MPTATARRHDTTTTPPETLSAPEPQKFEIINDSYAFGGAQAVLAYVPGYGRIARWTSRGRFGDEIVGLARIDPDPDGQPEILTFPVDEVDRFHGELDRAQYMRVAGQMCRASQLEISAADTELARFAKEWPYVADKLMLIKAKPTRIFEPGKIQYHAAIDSEIGDVPWEPSRDRHVSGDFGEIGRHDPALLEDPVACWMVALQDQRFRNAYNLRRQVGLIRSVYPLPAARKTDHVLHVTTALGLGRQPMTLMMVRHRNAPL